MFLLVPLISKQSATLTNRFFEREKILGTKLCFQLKGGKLMFLLVPLISKQSASLTKRYSLRGKRFLARNCVFN